MTAPMPGIRHPASDSGEAQVGAGPRSLRPPHLRAREGGTAPIVGLPRRYAPSVRCGEPGEHDDHSDNYYARPTTGRARDRAAARAAEWSAPALVDRPIPGNLAARRRQPVVVPRCAGRDRRRARARGAARGVGGLSRASGRQAGLRHRSRRRWTRWRLRHQYQTPQQQAGLDRRRHVHGVRTLEAPPAQFGVRR